MTLYPRLGAAGISTSWPFRYPQPVKISISKHVASSPRLSGTELSDNTVSKFTSLVRARVTAPGEGLSIWRFTSKLFRFRQAHRYFSLK